MPKVFINYRRADTRGDAGRLHDHLSQHVGQNNIFMDVKGIVPGDDLMKTIERAINECQVLLAIIGPQWLSVVDSSGNRRLDDPDDYVRLEIAAALRREIPVIPVLVGNTTMPSKADLPIDLQGLTRRLAISIDDRAFFQGVLEIVQQLKIIKEPYEVDVFICHASEDKDEFVRPLAQELQKLGLKVWYDEFTLKIGDNLRRSIDNGLAKSHFGIVVFSNAFFSKEWPQYELDGLAMREMKGVKVILPIWHKITKDEILKFSPSMVNKLALSSLNTSIREIAQELAEVVRDNNPPMA